MQLPFGAFIIDKILERFSINKLTFYRSFILVITYLIYFVYRLTRKPLSIVKSQLYHHNCSQYAVNQTFQTHNTTNWCDWSPFDTEDAKTFLGLLDTLFLFSYAIFMFMAGYVAERSNLRYFLATSLIICGIFCYLFGIAFYLNIHYFYYFIVIQILTGIAQSTGFPAVMAVVGKWFDSTKKGLIFGIWNSHGSLGNVAGAAIAGAFVETNWGLSFIVPGVISCVVAIIAFFFLIPSPQDVGVSPKKDIERNNTDIKSEGHSAISFFEAIKIPGVIEFSVCLFFAKLVIYTFMYWLPLYITESTHKSSKQSAFISIFFDIGSCFGAILAGYISDKSGTSSLTCISMFIINIPVLYLYYFFGPTSTILNESLQIVCGIFVNGPYSLIITAVSSELALKVESKNAVATVVSIIVGTGSIGGAIGPALSGIVSQRGWDKVFYMIMLADLLALLSLVRVGLNDFKRLQNKFSSGK